MLLHLRAQNLSKYDSMIILFQILYELGLCIWEVCPMIIQLVLLFVSLILSIGTHFDKRSLKKQI